MQFVQFVQGSGDELFGEKPDFYQAQTDDVQISNAAGLASKESTKNNS